jgi:hypothetical protein
MTRTFLVIAILLQPIEAHAKILFEGFYKVEIKGVHSGYTIIRHSLDEKRNERTFAYYRMKQVGAVTTLSGVSTTSTTDFKPISYLAWEALDGDVTYTRGVFEGGKVHVTRTVEKGNGERIVASDSKRVPSESVFSSLISQIVADRTDYRVGEYYKFDGVAEESSTFTLGLFTIRESYAVAGQTVYRVACDFLNERFQFLTTRDGEVLGTRSDPMNQITYLVSGREEALGTFRLNEELLVKTFGDLPKQGIGNPLASAELSLRKLIASWPPSVVLERR